MSKHTKILTPSDIIRAYAVLGTQPTESIASAKSRTGATIMINGGLFDMGTGATACGLKIGGVWIKKTNDVYGLAMNGSKVQIIYMNAARDAEFTDFVQCYGTLVLNGKPQTNSFLSDRRGRTAVGTKPDGSVVIYVCQDGIDALTGAELAQKMVDLGCTYAANFDGGGSSAYLGPDATLAASRKLDNFIAFNLMAKEDKPVSGQYLVAVDSGHGMETAGKRTPPLPEDLIVAGVVIRKKGETIKEKEFNRLVADALITALNRCGINTVDVSPGLTDVPLPDRVNVANKAKADVFISKHFNALNAQWFEGGYLVGFVSHKAGTATRTYAKCVMDELVKVIPWRSNGVANDTDYTTSLYVLSNTSMPALLTESGFMNVWEQARHMLNPEFIQQDAEATCKGICMYLGVKYVYPDAVTPTAPVSPVRPVLWSGAKGAYVVELQQLLTNAGHSPGPIDGVFGVLTKAAVINFQRVNGLTVDGGVGSQTWGALDKVADQQITPVTRPTIRYGSKGEDVKYLQTRLNAHGASPKLAVDGGFGALTEAAVKAFQRVKNLLVDGAVGPQTWANLG